MRAASLRGLASAVDLQHLRHAVAVADHRSFRRAAEALLLRQSTLSRRIRQLEERLNMIVFERSSRGALATQAGRDFLRMARSILEQMDTLVTSARNAGRGEAGRMTIGLFTSFSAGNLRPTLRIHNRLRCPSGKTRERWVNARRRKYSTLPKFGNGVCVA